MNRRDLIRNIAAGTATLFIVPSFVTSCEDDPEDTNPNPDPDTDPDTLTIDLANNKYSSLASVGGSIVESSIIIMNTGDQFLALSSVCTHQGCEVSYNHGNSNLPCPCHGSVFNTTGSVLQGPASSPLTKYEVTQEGDILSIAL